MAQAKKIQKWQEEYATHKASFIKESVPKAEEDTIREINEILQALYRGKKQEKEYGFKDWDGNFLSSARFKLANYLYTLGYYMAYWQERSDHVYLYYKVASAQQFTVKKARMQKLADATKSRATVADVEAAVKPEFADLEEFKIFAAGRYLELRSLRESVFEILTSLTHRIAELRDERNQLGKVT